MIETTRLPEEFIAGIGETRYPFGPKVEKRTLEGIDEIQYLYVSPWTSINPSYYSIRPVNIAPTAF